MALLNLSTHRAHSLHYNGLVDLPPADRLVLLQCLSFDSPPSPQEIEDRADAIANLVALNQSQDDRDDEHGFVTQVLMDNIPPFLVYALCHALLEQHMIPVFGFSNNPTRDPALVSVTPRSPLPG